MKHGCEQGDVGLLFGSGIKVRGFYNQKQITISKEWVVKTLYRVYYTVKKAKARGDKFGDVFFKQTKNAIYGKTIENV